MTKAVWTPKRNVKVTMTQDQFLIINELMTRTRLGHGKGKTEVFNWLNDLEEFIQDNFVEGDDFTYEVTLGDDTPYIPGANGEFVLEINDV